MSDDAATPQPPKLPQDGKEFFNTLMARIEPDLTLDHVHSLKEQYAQETPEEHEARLERYKQAFSKYREQRDHYFLLFTEQVRKYTKGLTKTIEAQVRTEEEKHLQELESHFA